MRSIPASPEYLRLVKQDEQTSRHIGDLFDDLAERGRFDEQGGELSDEDWDDARTR